MEKLNFYFHKMSLSEEMFLKLWRVYLDLLGEKKSMDDLSKSVNDAFGDLEVRVEKLEGELAVSKNANILLKK